MFTLQILDRGQTFLHAIDTAPIVIGSGPDADIRLGEAEVLPQHARIEPTADGARLTALAKVLINGRAASSAALALGDRIEIGRAVLLVGRSVRREAKPDDVLADDVGTTRRPTAGRRRAKWLPLLAAGGVLAFVVVSALQGDDGTRVRNELAAIARLRDAGRIEQAAAAVAKLRATWELATDDRLQRLAAEQARLDEIVAATERLTAQVQDPAIERGYAEWNIELQRIESDGAASERVAAHRVRSGLAETLRKRPKPVLVPLPPPAAPHATAAAPAAPVPPQPVPPAPAPAVARPAGDPPAAPSGGGPPAAAVDAAACIVEADRLVAQGLFAQALLVLQASSADAADEAAVASLRRRADAVRVQAHQALTALVARAERAIADGTPADAVALLAAEQHRFPPTGEFAALPQVVARAEAAVAAAARKVSPAAPAADESVRLATLAQLRSQMESVRAADERAAFAESARLLRDAALAVRERDPEFAGRLEGRAEEAELLAAWHEWVVVALQAGRALKTTVRSGRAVTLHAAEGPQLIGTSADGDARLCWLDVSAFGVALLAQQTEPTGQAALGAATLFYKNDDPARAEALLAKTLQGEPALKAAIDGVLARGRGEPADARGYTLGKDGFVSARSLELQKEAQKLTAKLDGALRDRNPAARDKLVGDALAAGPDAMPVLVAALQKDLERQLARIGSSSLRKQVDRLAEQRAALDAARHEARSLIYDEDRYFYPYKPPAVSSDKFAEYNRVQAEVDRRVAALRAIWGDERLRVRVPASLRGDLDRLDWVAKTLGDLGELDAKVLADVDWARALPPGDAVGIQEYCLNASERAELEEWRRIEAYNAIVGKQLGAAVREQLEITNRYRAMFRHRPLALVRSLCAASQGHADEMAKLGYFAHMSPTPLRRTPYDRMRLAGYTSGVSENIALIDGAEGAHNAWCHSSGHHRNLLDPSHREVGIGADGRLWVQNFGSGAVHRTDPAWAAAGGASSR